MFFSKNEYHACGGMMEEKYDYEEKTLLDVFRQGERVCQIYYDPDGQKKEYSGIIMKIKEHCMAVYWDKVDGKPVSNIHEVFNVFHESEIYNGNENASPIKKEYNQK